MATNLEVQANQKNKLFMLLKIRAEKNEKKDVVLDNFIDQVKAEMSQEDVAWVEKIVNKQ